MHPSRSTLRLRLRPCMSNLLPLWSLVRAGMATGTTMGVAIGSAGSGKSVIEVNGNGMTRETIAVTLEAVGATTMTAGGAVIGTATKEMTAGGMTTKTNGVGCCVDVPERRTDVTSQ